MIALRLSISTAVAGAALLLLIGADAPVDGGCARMNIYTPNREPTPVCTSGDPVGLERDGKFWRWTCHGSNGGKDNVCSQPAWDRQ